MHEEVINKTKEMFAKKDIRYGYVLFLFLTGLVVMAIMVGLMLFAFIPLIGIVIYFISYIMLIFMFAPYLDVSTYRAFEENKAPKVIESLKAIRSEGNSMLMKWFLTPIITSVVITVIAFALFLIVGLVFAIPTAISIFLNFELLTAITLVCFVIVYTVIMFYPMSAFNYVYFFLACESFSNLGYFEIIKMSFYSMKGHNLFYFKTVIKKALILIIVTAIPSVFFAIGTITGYVEIDIFASILMLLVIIFSWLYTLFYLTPFMKIFSYNLFKENLKDKIE